MKKKFLFFLLLSFIFLFQGFFLIKQANALEVDTSSFKGFQEAIQKSSETGEMNIETHVGNPDGSVLSSILNGAATLLYGEFDWTKIDKLVGDSQIDPNEVIISEGALTVGAKLISQLYIPPASSVEYFADLGRNLGIVKPAYAQGVGFSGLRNLLPLWKATRNIAYIGFVLVFMYMGLAIMLRVKLDPKTIVTIQNSIPKLVIALILVTFSYAIVGLMIDFIYLIIYLGIAAFSGPLASLDRSVSAEQKVFAGLTFFGAIGQIGRAIGEGIQSNPATVGIGGALGVVLSSVGLGIVLSSLGWAVAGGIIFLILIGAIIVFIVFKLFLALIECYITIVISLITAPLQILMGVIPGSQGGFGPWFKNLLANILVFPAVALCIFLASILMGSTGPKWTPPVLSDFTGNGFTAIVAFGMLLLTSKVPEIVKATFKIKPSGYGKAIGETLAPVKPLTQATAAKGAEKLEAQNQSGILSGLLRNYSRTKPGGLGEPGTRAEGADPKY